MMLIRISDDQRRSGNTSTADCGTTRKRAIWTSLVKLSKTIRFFPGARGFEIAAAARHCGLDLEDSRRGELRRASQLGYEIRGFGRTVYSAAIRVSLGATT